MAITKKGDEDFVIKAIQIINKKHNNTPQYEFPVPGQNESAKGTIECPKCKGVLHYTISGYNGHVWGKCEKEDCLRWMM